MRSTNRKVAIAGCCLALGTLAPVALFQGQLLDRLPDPPGEIFDSERLTLSKAAHPLGIPDSYLGIASYSTTLALLLLSERSRLARRLLGVKLAGDASLAAFNMVRQVVSFRKMCSWCTGTALATFAMVAAGRDAVGETVREVRESL